MRLSAAALPLDGAAIRLAFDRTGVYELARQLAEDNRFYFRCLSASQFRHRFAGTCETLAADLLVVEHCAKALCSVMLKYDFDAHTPGNGYRSVIAVVDSCVLHLIRLLRDISEQRDYVLFRTNYFCKELEAYAGVLAALKRDLYYATDNLHLWKSSDDLFPPEVSHGKLDALMNLVETFDHSCFYGRCMGFQYVSSLFHIFQIVGFGLASYSILWEKGAPDSISQTVTNLYQSGRFALNPEERAQRIADIIMNADISFCKSFWNLTEGPFLQDIPKLFCPNMAVNEQWSIPAREPLFLESTNGFYVKISAPSAHSGPGPVSLRVLSLHKRAGMPYKESLSNQDGSECGVPKSPNLLFHCHGGGFVATSSKTHEIYLRQWAQNLDCPIVSVDYSLAPEQPFPRALEEVLYAYAWVLSNTARLGWTGERLCFAGDSAGAHILMSVALRCLQITVKRLPDGLVLIYAPFMVEYSPSPSRLLSFLDPLLPPGIMARCIAAYLGVSETVHNKDGREVKSPITSNKATLSEYAFNLKQNLQKQTHDGALPEYELNLVNQQRKRLSLACESEAATTGCSAAAVKFTVDSPNGSARLDTPPSSSSGSHSPCCCDGTAVAPTETPRRSGLLRRQRSQSATLVAAADEAVNDELEAGAAEDQPTAATVRIRRDPRRIVVSSGAHDRRLIDFLSQHETTLKSLVRLPSIASCEPGFSMERRQRSLSTSSLSALGSVTGYVWAGLTSLMDTPLAPTAAASSPINNTPPSSPNLSALRVLAGGLGAGVEAGTGAARSRLSHFHQLPVPRDPLLSPLRADDQLLAGLPRVALLACQLDPLLDDSVTMAKRLRGAGVPVTLDLLDSLPHGFLNFTIFSQECLAGSRLCSQRIAQLLDAPGRR